MELTYTKTGDYLIPNLMMDEQPEGDIGVYGRMRKRFLKEHRRGTYNGMLLKGTLTQHLIETNEVAQDMMDKLIKQMAAAEEVTEALKRRIDSPLEITGHFLRFASALAKRYIMRRMMVIQ